MTITEGPLLREALTGQNKRRTCQFRANEGHFLHNKTKETVEANAETTVLCTFGPCTLSPNPTPGSVMPA